MASSGMLRLVTLVRTDVSEEISTYIIRVTRICSRISYVPISQTVVAKFLRNLGSCKSHTA
jgi:hypothetical protein